MKKRKSSVWELPLINPPCNVPILQLRKLILRDMKKLIQNYSARFRTGTSQLKAGSVLLKGLKKWKYNVFAHPVACLIFSQISLCMSQSFSECLLSWVLW